MGAFVIGLSVIWLLAATSVVLYSLLNLWPHPTPSGAPAGEVAVKPDTDAVATTRNRDTMARTGTAPAAVPKAPDSIRHTGAASERPQEAAAGSKPRAMGGLGGPLVCDPKILPRVYFIAPDSLQDPACVRLFAREFPLWAEQRLLLIVVLTGALGGLLHAIRSLGWYVGNRELRRSWLPYYLLLPFSGMIMALAFYVVLRGGLFSPSSSIRETSPFGFAAVAFLVGMFSPQAVLKLKQVAETFFARPGAGEDSHPQEQEADAGTPAGPSGTPTIASLDPAEVVLGRAGQLVKIVGQGFGPGSRVRVGDRHDREPQSVKSDGTTLTFKLEAEDVAEAGPLEIRVTNPGSSGGDSEPVSLTVKPETNGR